MKRKTALIMSTMLSLGLLAGCSGGETLRQSPQGAARERSQRPRNLRQKEMVRVEKLRWSSRE